MSGNKEQDEDVDHRGLLLGDFLKFLVKAREALKTSLVPPRNFEVEEIRASVEEHYLDDQGQAAMYQRLESALYDDARQMVTLWQFFHTCERQRLDVYQRFIKLEHDGLTGDRSPRKVFDRSLFGIAAIAVMTVTVWMTVVRTFTGEDVSDLLELIHFNRVAGAIWLVGLFVVLWIILKTLRNNHQVALLSSVDRALTICLDEEIGPIHRKSR